MTLKNESCSQPAWLQYFQPVHGNESKSGVVSTLQLRHLIFFCDTGLKVTLEPVLITKRMCQCKDVFYFTSIILPLKADYGYGIVVGDFNARTQTRFQFS